MDLFSFPFRFKNRQIASISRDTDQAAAQNIASVWQTGLGELPLLPGFGTLDPTFDRLDLAGFYSTMAQYFPQIQINEISESITDDGRVTAEVDFTRDLEYVER